MSINQYFTDPIPTEYMPYIQCFLNYSRIFMYAVPGNKSTRTVSLGWFSEVMSPVAEKFKIYHQSLLYTMYKGLSSVENGGVYAYFQSASSLKFSYFFPE